MIDPSRTRMPGPLQPFAAGFAGELSRQGFTPNSARAQMRLMAHVSRWLEREGLDGYKLGPTEVERFLRARRAAGYTSHLTDRALQPLLAHLRGLDVAPPPSRSEPRGPVEVALERYRQYLVADGGLGKPAAKGYLNAVRHFVLGRLSADGSHLHFESLTAADVMTFLSARCSRHSTGWAKLTATALRSFLGFLHLHGEISRPLSNAVLAVASWQLAKLPKPLTPDQLRSLLASCDRRTRIGRRDFAILTTLARLGLRAGEIATMQLDDIDWRGGEIIVRGKGNRVDLLPLPADVGDALAAYLRRGRPRSAEVRTVFVRVRAPHRALTSGGISQVVATAARHANLGAIRAHRLRHTAATLMLRSGATLPEIGQVLRHRRARTTAIYAKVDRDGLRTIARQWPEGGN